MDNLLRLPDISKLPKVIAAKDKRARVNIEKVQKIAKTVRNMNCSLNSRTGR